MFDLDIGTLRCLCQEWGMEASHLLTPRARGGEEFGIRCGPWVKMGAPDGQGWGTLGEFNPQQKHNRFFFGGPKYGNFGNHGVTYDLLYAIGKTDDSSVEFG